MTQDTRIYWLRVAVVSSVVLVALGLATALLLRADPGVSEAEGERIALSRGQRAYSARLHGAAASYLARLTSRASAAYAARLSGQAGDMLDDAEDGCEVAQVQMSRGDLVYGMRLSAQAAHYMGLPIVRTPAIDRGRAADAARLTAMAEHLGVGPTIASSDLACLIAP